MPLSKKTVIVVVVKKIVIKFSRKQSVLLIEYTLKSSESSENRC